jgi:2-oxoglutarate dehydrogenase E2 component (dihydrolipoamide succinyltransferase)
MRIVIETADEGTVVKGAAAQPPGAVDAPAPAPAPELAAAAAAIGAIDAGPGPTGPAQGNVSAPPLPAAPLGGPTSPAGTAGGLSAGAAPGSSTEVAAVQIDVDDAED